MDTNDKKHNSGDSDAESEFQFDERDPANVIPSDPVGLYKPSFQKQLAEACPPKYKVGSQLVEMFEKDRKRIAEDAMKKRAILTAESYEEFKNLVAASTLKPLTKDENLTELTKTGFNPIAQVQRPKRKFDLQMSLQQIMKSSAASGGKVPVAAPIESLSSVPNDNFQLTRQWRRLKPSQKLPRYLISSCVGTCANDLCERAEGEVDATWNGLPDASGSNALFILRRHLLLRLGKRGISNCFRGLIGDYDFIGEVVLALKPEGTSLSLSKSVETKKDRVPVEELVSIILHAVPPIDSFCREKSKDQATLTPFCSKCTIQLLSSAVLMEILQTITPDTLDMALHLLTDTEKKDIAMSFDVFKSMGGNVDNLVGILHGFV